MLSAPMSVPDMMVARHLEGAAAAPADGRTVLPAQPHFAGLLAIDAWPIQMPLAPASRTLDGGSVDDAADAADDEDTHDPLALVALLDVMSNPPVAAPQGMPPSAALQPLSTLPSSDLASVVHPPGAAIAPGPGTAPSPSFRLKLGDGVFSDPAGVGVSSAFVQSPSVATSPVELTHDQGISEASPSAETPSLPAAGVAPVSATPAAAPISPPAFNAAALARQMAAAAPRLIADGGMAELTLTPATLGPVQLRWSTRDGPAPATVQLLVRPTTQSIMVQALPALEAALRAELGQRAPIIMLQNMPILPDRAPDAAAGILPFAAVPPQAMSAALERAPGEPPASRDSMMADQRQPRQDAQSAPQHGVPWQDGAASRDSRAYRNPAQGLRADAVTGADMPRVSDGPRSAPSAARDRFA